MLERLSTAMKPSIFSASIQRSSAQVDGRRARRAASPPAARPRRAARSAATAAAAGAAGPSLAAGARRRRARRRRRRSPQAPAGRRERRHAELVVGVLEERAAGSPRRRRARMPVSLRYRSLIARKYSTSAALTVVAGGVVAASAARGASAAAAARGALVIASTAETASATAAERACGVSKRADARAPGDALVGERDEIERPTRGACAPVRVGGAIRLSLSPKVSIAAMLRRAEDVVEHAARLGLAHHVRAGVGADSTGYWCWKLRLMSTPPAAVLVEEAVAVVVGAFPVDRAAAALALLRIGAPQQARIVGVDHVGPVRILDAHHR